MTYADFVNRIKSAPLSITVSGPSGGEYIRRDWQSGGSAGGSLAGEWTDFYRILEACAPNLSFRQFRELTGLIQRETGSTPEYEFHPEREGVWSESTTEWLWLSSLFEFLDERNLLV